MGIFKNKEIIVYAPFNGTIKPIDKVKDQTFSQKILGDGVAIIPDSETIISPLDEGTILNVFHTKHAFGLSTGNGPELLVHVGMDTVLLKGEGIKSDAKAGDKLSNKKVLAVMDLKYLNKNVPSMESPIIITNDSIGSYKMEILKDSGKVKAGEAIFKLVK